MFTASKEKKGKEEKKGKCMSRHTTAGIMMKVRDEPEKPYFFRQEEIFPGKKAKCKINNEIWEDRGQFNGHDKR